MKKIINCLFRSAPGRYSHASDVWSFGVLAWELFAAFYDSNIMPRQTIPYYNHTNDEVTPCKILKFKISIPQGICMLKNQRNIKIKKPTWRLVLTEQHWRRNWVFFYSHTRLHGRRKNYLIVTSLQFPKVTRTWNFSYSITWHLCDFFPDFAKYQKKPATTKTTLLSRLDTFCDSRMLFLWSKGEATCYCSLWLSDMQVSYDLLKESMLQKPWKFCLRHLWVIYLKLKKFQEAI